MNYVLHQPGEDSEGDGYRFANVCDISTRSMTDFLQSVADT
ncbi:MAG: hypothetical protein NZM35_08660 [Chitinophagales bacterium]|nr:hypothetical protein [Chitinophagales bacterium]MDW8419021.1 hypothetical protein [Chitinophagales bacterium]